MDETLYRCANPDCKRLTYVTAEPAPAAGKSGWFQRPPSIFRQRGTGA